MHRFLMLLFPLLAWGCASVVPEDYARETPVLDLQRYFTGHVDAWGMFQDRGGRVVKRFTVHIEGTWDGDTGRLDERFVYSDGTRQQRIWTVRRVDDHTWTGTAPDVVGTAAGTAAGNALRWQYVLGLPVGKSSYHMKFDDWMYLIDDQTMVNRARMSKFGIHLGDVTLFFRRR